MRRRFALLAAPLLLVALLPGAATAAGPRPSPAAQSRASVLAYWTPERIASAKPIELARGGPVPDARPGGGGGGGTGNTTGASWPTSSTDPITLITGKVLFSMNGSNWVCSGSVMDDSRNGTSTFSVILTAGHCVVDSATGIFATNWLFVPAFDLKPTFTCGSTQLGCWTATALVARSEFAHAGGFTDEAVQHDWGFAVVQGGGKTSGANLALDATVGGGFGLLTGGSAANSTVTALGYPAAEKYHGNDLVYCKGTVGTDPQVANKTYSLPCGMTGGSSGGPWTPDPSNGYEASVRSLNSYGYSTIKGFMYGPMFNAETAATLSAANSATNANVLVGP